MIKRFFILLLAIVASVGMSWAQAGVVDTGTKGGMSYTFYDNGLLEISGSGALPGNAFTNWNGGFGASVKNIRFAEDCEVYGLDYLWFGCYTEESQLETIEINSVAPIMFSGASGAGIFYRQDGAVTLTITAPGIVDVENEIIDNYGSPVNMIFNMPATTVFEKKWFSGLENNFAVTIPTGAKGHIPAGYSFTNPYDQKDYDDMVAHDMEDLFWESHSHLVEGVNYTNGVESTFVITAENASQIFGQATVSFQAPTEASNSEWVLWRKSDLKTFSDMSSGDQKVYKDVTVKVNNGVYNTDSGFGVHFDSSDEDGVQFVAPEGKVFKRIVILNQYGTFEDPNWSYDGNYKKWSGSANTVGFEGDICGISLIEFEMEGSAPANSCGDGLTWELKNGELTISYTGTGTGVMDNYASASDAPWYSHKDDITSVTITDGVKSVGSYSFGYYGNLVTVTIGNDVETIGEYAFGDCYKFTTLNLGNSVKHIGNRAFMWAKVLTGFTLPSTLETIGERAFLQNKLITSLTIPSNVTSIGPSAFMYCAALTSVTVEATTPPTLGATVFDGVPTSSIPLHVPSGSVAAYTAADQWKDFDIQDPTPAYEKVINLINEIPNPVVFTAACKAKIDAARAAFDALSAADKDLVTNIATLTTAEAAFDNVMNIWLSGDCDVILWNDTTLTVRKHAGEGNGAMADYDYMSRAPWYNNHWYDPKPNDIVIKSVTIEEGVTHLGDYAFAWMSETKTVTIPSSVTTIPEDAFYWSKAVDDIYLTVADTANLTWALPYSADAQFKPSKATLCHVPADLLTAYQEKFGALNMTFVGDLDPITPLTPEQQQALDAVKGLINAIPSPVVYTPACKDAIDAARAAYDALTPDMLKQLVSNYATLTAAEATYANLKDVAVVEAKINAIPTPVELKLATRDSIESARAAYEALTDDQKPLVSNYQTLLDAEAALAALNPGGGMPAGALSGKFTINADGDQIAFAKGNLQATTTDLGEHWTWGFAANQWDLIGNAVANTAITGSGTVSANGTVDLFGWSTPTTYYGIHNSKNSDYYSGDFREWGENITGATWKTPSPSDWIYIISNRADAAQKHGQATVNGVNGYIFLPDEWELPTGLSFTAKPNNWTANVYDGDDWTAMENAGAVFLPKSPWRSENTVATITYGYYWSSDYNNYSNAMAYYFKEDASITGTGTPRYAGICVRLVTAGGGGATPLDSAQAVKDLIEAIPMPVTLDAACVNAVQATRDAYNALSDATKGALDDATVQKLNQAITDYTALIQAGADAVTAKIAAIPQPVTLKLATRDSIESARAAYDALTADQKLLVSNYAVLEAAEATWAGLINAAPAGALSGKYTINAGGDFIYFAKGNLQYTRENLDADWSTGTFRLATNQYDLIEDATYPNAYCTDNYGDKTAVGLFGWGTWGEGKTPNLTSSDKTLYTWSTDFSGTLEGTSTWRTLTKDEWVYLLAHNNLSYATVHDVNGLLVAPDGKDIDSKSMEDWVVINDETWTTMQNDGYLFLPACGQRSQLNETANITTGGQGEEVVYYSSTEKEDDANRAYNIWYKKGQAPVAADFSFKRQAFGVRLVSAGVNPLDQAQVVKDLIDAIPAEITLDAACVNAIQAARDAYNALSEDAKAILDAADVKKLTDAEQALKDLNQAEADKVVAKINNIPTPVELKLATRDSIESARDAYEALTAEQKALVPADEYKKLTDAEAALAELNKGGSIPMDIVWDGNTGIANVSPTTTSPAYEGMTVTVGQGSSFSTYQSRLYFTFNSQPNGGFIFANENGTNITKVVIESTTALTSTMKEVDRMGSGWVISNEYKTATWTGNADSVSIWKGEHFANYWVVDTITFTVSGSSTPLDSAQAVKDLIDAISTPVEYPTSGAAIEAALNAYDALSDAAKGALDDADVQKLNDAAAQYAALEAIAAIEAIPAEIVYEPLVKAAIETARDKFDALSDASKALVDDEVVAKLTNAEQAWAILVAKIEHNVSYIGKDGELKRETVALLNIPDPAPDFNGYEFDQWIVKAGDFLEEGLRIQASYTPIITTNPAAYDTLVYNGTAQTLIAAGVAKEGHIEYRLNDGEWSAELPKADMAAAYVVYYKLVREAHEDYMAGSVNVTIAKAPVAYTAPAAYDTLVYTASDQTLIAAGQTKDGTFEYSFIPDMPESWSTELPKAMAAGTYNVYYRVNGDLNHLDSVATDPVVVTIAKAELTATADNKAIIFGELAPQFTVTYTGWQGEDKDSVLTGDIAFACPYVRGNNVGAYSITPSGVEAANYTVNFVQGSLTVNRKSASSADIKASQLLDEKLVYTNAVNKPTIVVTDTTLQLTEVKDYNLTFVGRGETQYAEAATAPVHVGDYTAIVAFVGNYKDTLTVDFAIAKAPLTITAENKEIIFGENAPEFTVAYTGFLGTDTATVLTGSQAYACEYVRGDIVGDYTIIPSGVDAHDYTITFTNGTLTVNRKSATSVDIKASQLEGEKLVYTNAVNRPTIVVTDTTLQLTESKDYTLSFFGTLADNTPYAESATAPTHVGNYTAIVAFEGNYKDSLTVDFLINQAPLTITANDTAMIYGDEAPAFSVSYSGFLGTDDDSVLLGKQGYSCVYAPGSPIGTYAITPKDVTAYDYAITFVDGKLTVNKAVVKVSGAQVHEAKFADGHAGAEVTDKGTLNGVKLNDPLNHVTTASFSSAEVSEHLTITLFYELTGDAALINNYDLQPTSEIFTTEGVIIEPFHPDTTQTPEADEEQNKVQEGIEVYAYGYCEGDNVGLKYHLNSGNPDQYKIDFADSRFTDVDWTNLDITGPDGVIYIDVPVDVPTGDYNMTVYFRDSRFTWLESQALNVTFHVNLPETYVKPLFDNTIVLVDTCDCFTDIQWYYRATSSEPWAPIPGATGHYYRPENGTKLTGEYFVSAKMNGVPTYTCGQEDMETLYGADSNQQQAQVVAYPNPVESSTNVTIKNSTLWNHNLRVVNLMGIEVLNTTFEGDETIVNMSGFVSGNYMISVDGISVKVMKK